MLETAMTAESEFNPKNPRIRRRFGRFAATSARRIPDASTTLLATLLATLATKSHMLRTSVRRLAPEETALESEPTIEDGLLSVA